MRISKKLFVIALLAVLFVSIPIIQTASPYFPNWLKPGIESNEKTASLYMTIDDLRSQLFDAKDNQYRLEDALGKAEVDKRIEIKKLEAKMRLIERENWQLKDKLDNLQRLVDAIERSAALQVDEIQDEYEEELYDQILRIAELKKEITELKEELGKSIIGGWVLEDLEDFENMQEFIEFIASDNTSEMMRQEPDTWDCDDYCFLFMRNSALRGKRVYPCLIWSYINNQVENMHLMNFALVKGVTDEGQLMWHIVLYEPEIREWFYFGILDKPESWRCKLIPFLP